MIKLCIWMNIPSHYQSAFFQALDERNDVDLQVVYLNAPSPDRAAEGWQSRHHAAAYESFAKQGDPPERLVETVAGWRECTHVISGTFSSVLIRFFCINDVRWCHWSEMPGIRLAELLDYRMALFRIFNPLMLACKRTEGRRIQRYALGAFGQGRLARRAFRAMGVPDAMIADLYYAPSSLQQADPCEQMVSFANGRKSFLYVGALCRRKGVDVLLKAFAKLDAADWCLVFCGLDRANGIYQALARKLGIADRVLFLGAYPVKRITEVYAAGDVFVLPSRFDGWGAVLNEAASRALPLIGTDLCGGSWHVIDDGQNGYRVRADSASSLAEALRAYVENPARIQLHGMKALENFQNKFTPESNATRLVATLHKWVRE